MKPAPIGRRDAKPLVLAIYGPTASGKSAVAEALARRIPAEAVAADSAQLYRGLPILTNQSPARLVGIWGLDHEGSVGEYQQTAHEAIDEVLAAGKTPIVVGGTGLYMRAALAELELPPPPSPGVRQRFERLYEAQGAEAAHALLASRDPAAAAAVHPNDRRRVVRALELTETDASLQPDESRLWTEETRHPTVLVALDVPFAVLDERIEARTRWMFAEGVEQEARRALAAPLSATTRRILGLEELATLPTEEALEAIVRRTRQLARYQRKWMRRLPAVTVRADRPPDDVADEILEVACSRKHIPPLRERPAHARARSRARR
jgi:tRNA dimethylallyltransferase